jgi:hypothetical protein
MDKFKVLLMYSGMINMEATKERNEVHGLSVEYYFFGNNGEMVQPKISADGVSGTRRGKVFMTPDMQNKISFIPGIYDGTFEMSIGSDGKPVLKLVDIDFVGKAVISCSEEKAR